MLLIDPPRPRALGPVVQLLGLADTLERFSQAGVDEQVDPLEDPPVGRLPVLVVLPSGLVPEQPHSDVPRLTDRLIGAVELVLVGLGLPGAGAVVGVE